MNRAMSVRTVLYHVSVAGQSRAELNETTYVAVGCLLLTGIKPFKLLRR